MKSVRDLGVTGRTSQINVYDLKSPGANLNGYSVKGKILDPQLRCPAASLP